MVDKAQIKEAAKFVAFLIPMTALYLLTCHTLSWLTRDPVSSDRPDVWIPAHEQVGPTSEDMKRFVRMFLWPLAYATGGQPGAARYLRER